MFISSRGVQLKGQNRHRAAFITNVFSSFVVKDLYYGGIYLERTERGKDR